MVEWFNRHVAAWMDGTEALSDAEYRVYDVVLNLIYLNDGPIVNNERGIAGRCNMSARLFRVVLAALISNGKLEVFEGKISNKRARTELEQVANHREKSAKGGRTSAERRRNLLKLHEEDPTPLPDVLPSKEVEIKERERYAPQGNGEHKDPPDQEAQLFIRGKEVLGANAGGLVAKLLKATGSVAKARAVVETASTKGMPREYVGAAIKSGEHPEKPDFRNAV